MHVYKYIYIWLFIAVLPTAWSPKIKKIPLFLLQYKFKHNCTNIWKSNILINILYSRIILPLWESHPNLEEEKAEQCFTG